MNGSEEASAVEVLVTITAATTAAAEVVDQINNQILLSTTLSGAGIQAGQAAGVLTIESTTGSTFRLSVDDLAAGVALQFNDSDAGGISGGTLSGTAGLVESTINSGGARQHRARMRRIHRLSPTCSSAVMSRVLPSAPRIPRACSAA